MPQQIVECVPNISEGRNVQIVDAVVEAVKAVPGVTFLDRSSDADHNRSVLTFAGPPDAVVAGAFACISKAAELIDMDQHEGGHPRMGATDVCPFIPVSGVTMDECVELARALGKRVADELGIPVYLYEKAAMRPERENLARVRKGQYEGIRDEIVSNPDRAPDFGPARLGKAGITAIGARPFLIAYNVYLTTDEVGVAKAIGKAVRHSSGGLRFVKGMGLLVDGRAQVSMNLTDYTRTPVYRVQEMIRREANRYGADIHHAELVGLIPQEALIDSAQWYLQLDQFERRQVLEIALAEAAPEEAPASAPDFLDQLAAGTATPGGGSAAAYSGAMAAGLAAMVARLTIGKKKYAEVESRMQAIVERAEALRATLHAGVQRDAAAFDGVMEAFRRPKESEAQQAARKDAIESATHVASEVPLETARQAAEVVQLAAELAETGNVNAVTDAAAAASLAHSAVHVAGLNVKINATSVRDRAAAAGWLNQIAELEASVKEALERAHAAVRARGGIS
ncbi:MAG: glutamate formimidoyltransferase [Anaerolineales bacterium]